MPRFIHAREPEESVTWNPIATGQELPFHSIFSWNEVFDRAVDAYRKKVLKKTKEDTRDLTARLAAYIYWGEEFLLGKIEFSDGGSAIVKYYCCKPESYYTVLHEADTMGLVRRMSSITVPPILDHEVYWRVYEDYDIYPWILMGFFSGDTAMFQRQGIDPSETDRKTWALSRIHTTMAELQATIASLRFEQIGQIQYLEGRFVVGPIPGVGGPFNTAAEYFKALVKAPVELATRGYIYDQVDQLVREGEIPAEDAKDLVQQFKEFPSMVADLAERMPFSKGPFPLMHMNMAPYAIFVDEHFEIQALMDWQDSLVVPWEIYTPALTIHAPPAVLDNTVDRPRQSHFRTHQKAYTNLVVSAEQRYGKDNKLSSQFADSELLDLAQAFWSYRKDEHIGFYKNVIDPLLKRVKKTE
ncbi:hypothetical protein S40293_09557 [Stachybotrys chartarum IBT 40293]|nr:hypothetical protein S40293_09557 [Stachybotrys chartarum IBT 40293]